jgi:hypothetical protein
MNRLIGTKPSRLLVGIWAFMLVVGILDATIFGGSLTAGFAIAIGAGGLVATALSTR